MKQIEKIDLNDMFCHKIWNLINTSLQTPFFELAVKIGVFDKLIKPMSAGQLADSLGLNPDSTKPFLAVLVSMGLLDLAENKYINKPQTTRFLTTTSPITHVLGYQRMNEMLNGILCNLEKILREGGEQYRDELLNKHRIEDEGMWSRAARSMLGGGIHQAQLLAPHIKAMPEWHSFRKMMDLGGGPGAYCMVFVSEHPDMEGVVFDQPGVAAEAAEIISEYGLQERIKTQPGNYMTDDKFGEGYDFVWSSATLNFAKGQLTPLFKKIYKALSPGGVFASFHPVICGSGEESWEMVVGFAPHAMLGVDMQFYDDEISNAMLAAGFQTVQSKDIRTFHGIQRLDVARKSKE